MKFLSIPTAVCLGLLFLCAGSLHAVTPFSDSFSTPTNTNRWKVSQFGSGEITSSGGKVIFTVPKSPTGDDSALFALKGIQPTVDENWEVIVDVSNTTAKGHQSGPGLAIENAADPNDAVFIEFYSNWSVSTVNSIFMTNEKDDPSLDISRTVPGSHLSLRATYQKATRIITLSYRSLPSGVWIRLSSFSPFNRASSPRRGDWKLNPKIGKFNVVIYGFSDGNIITSGGITLDNFSIR